MTEITLRLRGIMEKGAATAIFPTTQDAANTVFKAIRCGLGPAAIELMDPPETVRGENL